MKHRSLMLGLVVLAVSLGFASLGLTSTALGGAYQDAVLALQPTYYYELNETDPEGGIVDTMGNAPDGELNGDYSGGGPEIGIAGPDIMLFDGAWTEDGWDPALVGLELELPGLGEGNLAHASNNTGHVDLGESDLFGASTMTVAMFARGGPAQGGDRLFTNNLTDTSRSFQMVVGNDGLVVSVNPTVECPDESTCGHRSLFLPDQGDEGLTNVGADRGMNNEENGWWHIVASTQGETWQERVENIRVWLNGVERSDDMKPGTTGWGVDTDIAKIGGRRADPLDSTTHSGAQDEVAIWLERALTNEEALSLFNAAVSPDVAGPICDFDDNGACELADMDALLGAIGTADARFDLDSSGAVDGQDIAAWLESAGDENQGTPYLAGDANFDGNVDASDLNVVGLSWQSTNVTSWAKGDFNGDQKVDATDLNSVGLNWQKGSAVPAAQAAVPEPSGMILLLWGALFFSRISTRRKRS